MSAAVKLAMFTVSSLLRFSLNSWKTDEPGALKASIWGFAVVVTGRMKTTEQTLGCPVGSFPLSIKLCRLAHFQRARAAKIRQKVDKKRSAGDWTFERDALLFSSS